MSSDPGDIHSTLASLVADRVRVSIIGLSAHIAICAELCARTNAGDASTYRVALDEPHLRDLLMAATTPPVSRSLDHSIPSLLMMGFPSRSLARGPAIACACHNTPVREGYPCTHCATRVCKLPAVCPACGLTLILSTHLARSYHHLFPLRGWVDVSWASAKASPSDVCFSCLTPFPTAPRPLPLLPPPPPQQQQRVEVQQDNTPITNGIARKRRLEDYTDIAQAPLDRSAVKGISESGRYACVVCGNHFCIDCDVFAHEVLHNCPGCQSLPHPGTDALDGAMAIDTAA